MNMNTKNEIETPGLLIKYDIFIALQILNFIQGNLERIIKVVVVKTSLFKEPT